MKIIKHMCLILLLAAVMMLPGDVANAAQRVTLYKGETVVGQYEDIMSAFAAMDDASGDYVVELTNDGTAYNIQKDYTWPEVNSIYISGGRSVLYIEGTQVLQSNIVLDSVFIYQVDYETGFCIDMQDYNITFHGKVILGQEGLYIGTDGAQIAYSNVNLVGTEGSMLEVEAEQSVELYCGTIVEKIVITDGKVMFRGTNKEYQISEIEVYDGSIELASVMFNGSNPGTVDVDIERFVNCGNSSNLYIWMENNSALNIGEVDSAQIKDFSLYFAKDGYMNDIENMDITIESVMSNVSEIFFQFTAYVWSEEETVYDVITVDKLVTVPNFSGKIHGRYAVHYYIDGEDMGYESGTFQTMQKENDYYMDYDSFETTYLERSYVCGDYVYQITEENTAQITSYKGTDEVWVIPEELDGYTVTCLSDLNNGLRGVKEIVIPATLKEIGYYALINVPELEKITVADGNPYFKSIDGVLYSADETILYRCPHTWDSITISDKTTTIYSYAFARCKNLTSIEIPDTVTTVGGNAFQECTALEYAKLPKNMTSVYSYLFAYCTNLKVVILPTENDCSMSYNVFMFCKNLKRIYVPENVVWVDVDAFDSCEKLDEIIFLGENTAFRGTSQELFNSCAYNLKVYCPDGSATQSNLEAYNWSSSSLEEVETFRIQEKEISLAPGDTYQVYVNRNWYDKELCNASITWKSSNTAVANVDANGLVTVVGTGNATISATCNGTTLTMELESEAIPVTDISLNYSFLYAYVGEEWELVAKVTPTTATNSTVIWSSSDESIATVDQTGKVSAHKPGTVVITATAADGSGVTATCTIEVEPIYVEDIIMSETQLILGIGEEYTLTAKVTPDNATIKDVEWYSDNPNVVSVDENGKLTGHSTGGVLVYARATDGSGCSAACWVIVKRIPLQIVQQPQSQTVAVNDYTTFKVDATGTGLTYQWQYSQSGNMWYNSGLGGAKTASLVVQGLSKRDGQMYRCVVTDANGNKVISDVVTLTIKSYGIAEQPESQSVNLNKYVTFTVKAFGEGLSYQWQYSQSGNMWYNSGMTGAKTASLTVQGLSKRDGQMYRCVITDASGNEFITDVVTLTVNAYGIVKQPESQCVNLNEYVTFVVEALGDGLSYQWQYSQSGNMWYNSGMEGAKTASLMVQGLSKRDGQMYRCVITDANGNEVISDVVTLTVKKYGISKQPESQTANLNEYVMFTVEAFGEGLTYQWQYSQSGNMWYNSGMEGAKTASLTVQGLAKRDGQMYRCVVTDADGNQFITEVVTLTVSTYGIIQQPESQTVSENEYAIFTVKAIGEGVSYQWQYSQSGNMWYDSGMEGAQTSSLTVQGLAKRDGQMYRCVVTDENGNQVVSEVVVLSIK